MNSETSLIVELWETIREHVPANRRVEIASGILKAFQEYGFEASDIAEIDEEDTYLSGAFRDVYEMEPEEEDEEEDA